MIRVSEEAPVVLISQYLVHHDRRFFTDPDQYDPDRWLPERVKARPKYSYFPFGGGTRVCIGESFAWTEAILLLATIAQRWRFVPDPSAVVTPEARITMRPRALKMAAEPR